MANFDTEARRSLPLPPAVFRILIALGEGEKHGYAVMQEVAQRTDGQVRMSPGTLYGSIRKMLDDGLVEEAFRRAAGGRGGGVFRARGGRGGGRRAAALLPADQVRPRCRGRRGGAVDGAAASRAPQ